MSEWSQETVWNLQQAGVLLVEDGNHGEYRPRKDEFCDNGCPFIRPPDLIGGRVDFKNAEMINEVAFDRVRKGKGRPGDILFSHRATVGRMARVGNDDPQFVANPGVTIYRCLNEEVLDRTFLYFHMQHNSFMDQVWAVAGSTDTFPYASLTEQRKLLLWLPPIAEQREIAAILGALDDKIELNRKTAATLEEMARALYRSWFVDFDPVRAKLEGRAPAHMDAAIAALFPDRFDEEGLPEGWYLGTLGEIATIRKKVAKPADLASETPYIGLEHMPRKSIAISEWGTAADIISNKTRMEKGQFLFGKLRPYFHKVGIAPVDGVCSTDILVIDAVDDVWRSLVLSIISSDELVAHTTAVSNGARMPRAKWQDLADFGVCVPSHQVASAFSNATFTTYEKILGTIYENHTLATLRDMLLPKLMSGELGVGAAREQVEEVA